MTQQIIGFSGKKQSGKNTSCNFLVGLKLFEAGIVKTGFTIDEYGHLVVGDLYGDTDSAGVFDITAPDDFSQKFLLEKVIQHVNVYSFADLLKKNVCMDIFGMSYEQCYGSDEDKKTLTQLKWEDMPGVVTPEQVKSLEGYETGGGTNLLDSIETKNKKEEVSDYWSDNIDKASGRKWILNTLIHSPGQMTAREVLQFCGTEVFRRMCPNVWSSACLRQVVKDGSELALIADTRFPDEVEAIKSAGGKVVRLLRNSDSKDTHFSETALDKGHPNQDGYDWSNFDLIVDNRELEILDCCTLISSELEKLLYVQA